MRMKTDPNIPKLNPNPTMLATEKLRSRNSRSGHERRRGAGLPPEERRERDAAADEAGEHLRAVPAGVVAANDSEHDAEHAESDQDDAEHVGANLVAEAVRAGRKARAARR